MIKVIPIYFLAFIIFFHNIKGTDKEFGKTFHTVNYSQLFPLKLKMVKTVNLMVKSTPVATNGLVPLLKLVNNAGVKFWRKFKKCTN